MKLVNDPGWKLEARGGRVRLDIYDVIGESWDGMGVSAKAVSEALQAEEGIEEIDVHLNSPGGSAFDGITIHNLLAQHEAAVHVHIDGLAASAATIVAMAGDTITIAENAMMMIHQAWGVTMGNAEEHDRQLKALQTLDKQILKTYVSRTGGDEDELRQMMADETWFSAEEAVELGLADDIVNAKRVAASFDPSFLQHFQNTPANVKRRFNRKRKGRHMARRKNETDEERRNREDEEERNEEERENATEEEERRNASDKDPENEADTDDEEERRNEGGGRDKENSAATLAALKNALPNAGSDFWVECLDKGRSVTSAVQVYNLKLEERLTSMEASNKRPGVSALGSGAKASARDDSADPVEAWNSLIDGYTAKGMNKHEATARVARENPELRQSYVAACNSRK